ncbi:hypothetical protein V6N11_082953 [Hibiscus sabdariffa]|uniref:RNase H type-1 domain-containing protein n=1 Tax=Hibiscus sabdariffa TaxID=183260 RepID=A0ABR2QKZ1_9ROSI
MVVQLLDDDGNVCVDQSVLSRMAVDYFQKLFSSSGPTVDRYPICRMFPGLGPSVYQELGREIGPLANYALFRDWSVSKDVLVRDMVILDDDWNWTAFETILPVTVLVCIAGAKPPCVDDACDFPVWKPNGNHDFTIRSVYAYCALSMTDNPNPLWRILAEDSVFARLADVRWEVLPIQWCKLNVDGACDPGTGRASCGGAIRNDLGQWMIEFSRQLGICSSLEAEMWVILDGLLCAWSIRVANLILESDCKKALQIIDKARSSSRRTPIVDHILRLLDMPWVVRFGFIPREGNVIADGMAKRACGG